MRLIKKRLIAILITLVIFWKYKHRFCNRISRYSKEFFRPMMLRNISVRIHYVWFLKRVFLPAGEK